MSPERRHMGRVAALGCILCRRLGIVDTPAEVHHIKAETGGCDQQSDFLTLPLCPRHHRVEYPTSVHFLKKRGIQMRYKCDEWDLLADVLKLLEKGRG